MSLVQIGALEVISLRLSMPLAGAWTAEAEVDTAEPLSGSVVIAVGVEDAATVEFSGTVLESRAFEGRARAFIVGGRGGLRRELPPRQYQLAPPRLIVSAILREAGEEAGELEGLDGLPVLARWVRVRARAAEALNVVCRRAGVSWRVRRNGTILVGVETWPVYAGRPFCVSEDGAHARAVYAQDAPDIEPGILFDGRRVGRVVHRVDDAGAFRTEVLFEEAS
ncbi:hypothetical protein [Polyangium sorediatum]|uniref:Uncharacterized protein n=1 Tax=Polyangium sorediatum TaxID=889274 RepID=A0ABT6NPH1_9BACT|nr:hypothetical protein [Polyangium sorediatum]MDI1430227.1 hypothetical protein [Polyangium sorediatum]